MPEHPTSIPTALSVSELLTLTARELKTRLDQRFATIGLTTQQAAVLLHTANGTSSPRLLADLIGTDTAGMTRLADRLVAKGLVDRQPSIIDRRAVEISLTKEGSALVPRIPPIFGRVSIALTSGLGAVEIEMLTHSLRQVLANISHDDPTGPQSTAQH